jgi:hypothetical protein
MGYRHTPIPYIHIQFTAAFCPVVDALSFLFVRSCLFISLAACLWSDLPCCIQWVCIAWVALPAASRSVHPSRSALFCSDLFRSVRRYLPAHPPAALTVGRLFMDMGGKGCSPYLRSRVTAEIRLEGEESRGRKVRTVGLETLR